jgi:hypothetical protein
VSISKLKKKAWTAFSLYIRTKYASPMGQVICYTCGKLGTIKTMQAGHGIAGRNNAVLFEEDLVRPQCVGCNFFGGGKYGIFMDKLIKQYGAERFSQLVMMSTMTVQRKAQDYIEIYETYTQKLHELV